MRARRSGLGTPLTLLSIVVALALGWFIARRGIGATTSPETHSERLAPTDTVLVAVRNLARLESVAFHMERVIDLKQRQVRMFGMVETQDAILLVAAGDVSAGLDLSKLKPGDVQVHPTTHSVLMRLPPPELLSVRLDNERTYVHSRKTDLLAKPDLDMEKRARQLAEETIRSAALDTGILERARENAERTLGALLRSLGYEQFELSWRE